MRVNEERHNEELARYKADKERQEYENALVIIKPSLKYASFGEIRDRLMVEGNEERALLLSSNEGFEFYDDISQRGYRHCIFSINNECQNRIEFINLDVSSTITTATDAREPYNYKSAVKWLRKNEMILLRIHNNKQRDMRFECLDKKEVVTTVFDCTITYKLTTGQTICYEYSIKITETPRIEGENKWFDRKTEPIKDDYRLVDGISSDSEFSASLFRDLQESLNQDRFGYRYQRIGEEQMHGTLAALRKFGHDLGLGDFVNNATNTANDINKSMQDVSQSVQDLPQEIAKMVWQMANARNQGMIEAKENDEVTSDNES
jgi:hypothetical protein